MVAIERHWFNSPTTVVIISMSSGYFLFLPPSTLCCYSYFAWHVESHFSQHRTTSQNCKGRKPEFWANNLWRLNYFPLTFVINSRGQKSFCWHPIFTWCFTVGIVLKKHVFEGQFLNSTINQFHKRGNQWTRGQLLTQIVNVWFPEGNLISPKVTFDHPQLNRNPPKVTCDPPEGEMWLLYVTLSTRGQLLPIKTDPWPLEAGPRPGKWALTPGA